MHAPEGSGAAEPGLSVVLTPHLRAPVAPRADSAPPKLFEAASLSGEEDGGDEEEDVQGALARALQGRWVDLDVAAPCLSARVSVEAYQRAAAALAVLAVHAGEAGRAAGAAGGEDGCIVFAWWVGRGRDGLTRAQRLLSLDARDRRCVAPPPGEELMVPPRRARLCGGSVRGDGRVVRAGPVLRGGRLHLRPGRGRPGVVRRRLGRSVCGGGGTRRHTADARAQVSNEAAPMIAVHMRQAALSEQVGSAPARAADAWPQDQVWEQSVEVRVSGSTLRLDEPPTWFGRFAEAFVPDGREVQVTSLTRLRVTLLDSIVDFAPALMDPAVRGGRRRSSRD
jgi:hypothetical protein